MDNYKEYLDPKDGYALVKSSIDMPVHPTWIEIPAGATTAIYYLPTKKVYFWKGEDVHWDTGEWMDCKAAQLTTVTEFLERNESRIVWKRTTQDPALISGAEAKLAWDNGEALQINKKDTHFGFIDMSNDYSLGVFDNDNYEFRLKPQTIKVELELPKPFEPKLGEMYWWIDATSEEGYSYTYFDNNKADQDIMQYGAYRTEDEIKQVVEQLRKIRGTNS
ncbi:hypothetical protein V8P80_14590 [Acinetobacter baumannii]